MLTNERKFRIHITFIVNLEIIMWKITLYLLFVALPMWGITSFFDENPTTSENIKTESVLTSSEKTPTDGAILGSIITNKSNIALSIYNEKSQISKPIEASGDYFLKGFEDGIYTIEIVSQDTPNIQFEKFEEVIIRTGEVTALGTVTID